MSKTGLKPRGRTVAEVVSSAQENFIKGYGRLLTEEEVVKLVDEIRADLRKKGEIQDEV